MPIYEYQCRKCKYRFEQLQKVTDKPLRLCPKCKKLQLAKLVSNTSFQLKGTGWYVTDFKNNGTKKTKNTEKQSSPKKKKPSPNHRCEPWRAEKACRYTR